MPFHLDSLRGLLPVRACAMDWGRNRILRIGKNSGPVLSCLWTKVYELLRRRRSSLIASNALVRLCMFHSEDISR